MGDGVEEGAYLGVNKEGKARECERVREWVKTKWATVYISCLFEVIFP